MDQLITVSFIQLLGVGGGVAGVIIKCYLWLREEIDKTTRESQEERRTFRAEMVALRTAEALMRADVYRDSKKWEKEQAAQSKDWNEKWAAMNKEFNEKWAAQSKDWNEKWSQQRADQLNESKDFHARLCKIEERRGK